MAVLTAPVPESIEPANGEDTSVPSNLCDALPIFIAPPLGLDNKAECCRFGSESKQKNVVYRVLDILKGVRPGTDLTSFQVPPQFNMPKSQLQCYAEQVYCCGQNLLEQCADATTPLDRFLAVVRWHISLTRPAVFAKAPYNPILGETHHVTCGGLNLLVEQVSHHPSVTALYATNAAKKIQVFQCSQPIPKFYGTSVDVTIEGVRTLTLAEHGELYEMTSPNLSFRFFPTSGCDWTGDTKVLCTESDLEALVYFKPRYFLTRRACRNQIRGKILRSSTQEELYTLRGCWDDIVMLQDKGTKTTSVLYDGKVALSNLQKSVVKNPEAVSPMDSVIVWSKLTEGVWNQDWERAREAKITVEENERFLRKQRLATGQNWTPKYFSRTVHGEWEWAFKGQPVLEGPIVGLSDPQVETKTLHST